MNIYAIGDIHGEFDKLLKLISLLNLKKEDLLVFLGDYIDRGKKSFEVIEYLYELNKKYNCIFLRGNHELMLRQYLTGKPEGDFYLYNGGRTTMSSYEKYGFVINPFDYLLPREHISFMQRLKPYYETDEYIFVHAGIMPEIKLEDTPDTVLYWDRDFNYEDYKGPKTVVYGHTPYNEVLNAKYKICIDTGACFESMGNLTCVKLPERKFINQNSKKEI